jgi:hypothetical protein
MIGMWYPWIFVIIAWVGGWVCVPMRRPPEPLAPPKVLVRPIESLPQPVNPKVVTISPVVCPRGVGACRTAGP